MRCATAVLLAPVVLAVLAAAAGARAAQGLQQPVHATTWAYREDGADVVLTQSCVGRSFVYRLTPRSGRGAQRGAAQEVVIEVPIRSAAVLDTPFLPAFDSLGEEGAVAAVMLREYVSTPSIVARLDEIAEVGVRGGAEAVNVSALVAVGADLVLASDYYHAALEQEGVPGLMVHCGNFEQAPLGRSEWLLWLGVLFGRPDAAAAQFGAIEQSYEAARNRVKHTRRPRVVAGRDYDGVWYVPGGLSYVAALIADAGGEYVFGDKQESGSVAVSQSEFLSRAQQAEHWIDMDYVDAVSLDPLAANLSALLSVPAFACEHTYNRDLLVNAAGYNEVFELGAFYVALVLEDLAAILHPDTTPHHFHFYRRLTFHPATTLAVPACLLAEEVPCKSGGSDVGAAVGATVAVSVVLAVAMFAGGVYLGSKRALRSAGADTSLRFASINTGGYDTIPS